MPRKWRQDGDVSLVREELLWPSCSGSTIHLKLFKPSQESWPSEIVMIINQHLAQTQAASPIFTLYGSSGLISSPTTVALMRGEARSRFSWHTHTYVCHNNIHFICASECDIPVPGFPGTRNFSFLDGYECRVPIFYKTADYEIFRL